MPEAVTVPAPVAPVVEVRPTPPAPPPTKVQLAEKAWDNIRLAAEVRAKAAAKPAETPSPAAPVVPPPEVDAVSTKFAHVARLERQSREALKLAKAERESLAKTQGELKAQLDAIEKDKAAARENPVAWLARAGLTYKDVTDYQLNGGKPTPEATAATVKADLESLKRSQAEAQQSAAKAEKERLQAQQTAEYDTWKAGVVDFVRTNAAKYELIHQQGAFELVPAVIQHRFDASKAAGKPVLLTQEEAAGLVEKHLEDEALKLLQAPKLAARFKAAEPATPEPASQSPTIHNGLTASASSVGRPRSWAEKKEAARLAMEKATSR